MELIMGEEASAAGEWYVVRTRGADAAIAAVGLEKAGMAVFMPVELIRTGCRGNRCQPNAVTWRPVFMGYVFLAMYPARDLPRLREIAGVDGELRRNGKLVPVSDDAIAALRSAERRGLFDLASACRVPDDDAPPPDVRFASLVKRIKRERGSKQRAKLLMELLATQDACKMIDKIK
jgi:hypothetical protein